MRILTLFLVIFMGMRFVQAQVPSMACPIPLPGPTWINESASSLGSTGTFTFSTDVEIDGAFTVDVGTFTFNGAEVTVVSGGDIFVNPGCTLRVINGTVITNVQNLWNGITVSPGGYLDIIDSDVCGSINAVYASNGYSSTPAEFNIENSGLRKNVTGVRVLNYNGGSYPGYIVGTHFEGGTLPAGSTFTHSYDGVVTTNVGSGSAFVGNTMKDCLHGVYVTGYETAVINNNTMTAPSDSFRTGIIVERTRLEISVVNNEIRQFGKLGILLDDNPGLGGGPGVDAAVSDNVIRGENLKTKAIFVDELVGSITGGITMKGNVIDRVWRGIGVQSSAGTINIRDNQVDFRYPGTSITPEPAAGIYILSSEEALLLRNTISGNCPVPAGGGPCNAYSVANSRVRGIQLNQTLNTEIYNNNIQYSGAGVYVQGSNFEGNMVCNDFYDNFTAVLWDNLPTDGFGVTGGGTYSNRVQGLGTVAPYEDWSENTFTSSVPLPLPNRSISINSADAASVDWFYQGAPTYDFPGGTILNFGGTSLMPTVGDPTTVCSTLLLADSSGGSETIGYTELTVSEEELNQMVRARTSAGDLENIYAQLSAWHQIGLSSAVLDSLLNLTSIREFEQVQSFWLEGDLVSIEAKLATINPAVPLETFLKQVWQIQLAAVQTGSSSSGTSAFPTNSLFSPIDREVLQAIALDTVSSHAQAMYKAQSLLEWSLLGDRWLLNEEVSRIAYLTGKSSPVKLYPNPAQYSATIESGQPIATIKLYDLKGLLVRETDAGGVMAFVLDLKTIAIGEYLVAVVQEDGGIATTKLVVQ